MPTLYTTLRRADADGNAADYDVRITFDGRIVSPYVPATWHQPAEGPEVEIEFVSAAFDPGEPEDAPGRIKKAEKAYLRAWLLGKGWDAAARLVEEEAAGLAINQVMRPANRYGSFRR